MSRVNNDPEAAEYSVYGTCEIIKKKQKNKNKPIKPFVFKYIWFLFHKDIYRLW